MDKEFYLEWFKGFSEGIGSIDEKSRSCLLNCCAKKCADTGVLAAYQKHFVSVNGNRDEFYRRIDELGGARGEVIIPNKKYAIYFPRCFCDLHTTGGVDSNALCECSRQSIIYIGEKIWGTDTDFTVENKGTVLSGNDECCFHILFES